MRLDEILNIAGRGKCDKEARGTGSDVVPAASGGLFASVWYLYLMAEIAWIVTGVILCAAIL